MAETTGRTRLFRALMLVLGVAVMAASTPAGAEGIAPTVPPAVKGETCVNDPDVMRKDHMDFLKHDRDATMHEGIRDTKYSLRGCMDCHQVPGADGQPVTIESEKHFCNVCHDFVGVQPDCFQCHTSTPEGDKYFEMTEKLKEAHR